MKGKHFLLPGCVTLGQICFFYQQHFYKHECRGFPTHASAVASSPHSLKICFSTVHTLLAMTKSGILTKSWILCSCIREDISWFQSLSVIHLPPQRLVLAVTLVSALLFLRLRLIWKVFVAFWASWLAPSLIFKMTVKSCKLKTVMKNEQASPTHESGYCSAVLFIWSLLTLGTVYKNMFTITVDCPLSGTREKPLYKLYSPFYMFTALLFHARTLLSINSYT